MSANLDDLDALRSVINALEPFDAADRERLLRWACEKLGIALPNAAPTPTSAPPVALQQTGHESPPPISSGGGPRRDLRSFVDEKEPASDTQFATAVAYFYAFEAPDAERKVEITGADLVEACRLTNRRRLPAAGQTLRNAMNAGFLDRSDRGAFKINTVGENLVAMALPSGDSGSGPTGRPRTPKKGAPAKKAAKRARTKKAAVAKKAPGKRAAAANKAPAKKAALAKKAAPRSTSS